ncbi:MAG: class I tRNA ligase family protein [Candidatus Paceibacterota bacterium]
MKTYDHKKIESKWQKDWEKKKIYKTLDFSKKPKYYVLDMFPYLSGEGLHVGHPKGYIATDVISRMKRMQGANVMHPMGFDAFGLPAENYAIKTKTNPAVSVPKNVIRFKKQLEILGFDYDWSREVNTTDPKFYKWTQWIFLKLLEKGLAYESYEPINWCPSCKTGLANEDVEDGKCERCGFFVEQKPMRQWVLRITDYAERLLKDLDSLNWPESIKESQKNWIGKSEGSEIEFKIKNPSPALPKGKGEMPGYYTTDSQTWKLLQGKVLEMRENSTEAEKKLWQILKKNKEYHFRRQHIINKFIVDFVCLSKNLVIEVDGDIHDLQKEKDEERTEILKILGFKVIRFKNEEVLKNIDSVINKINKALKVLPFGEDLGGVELGSIKVFTTRADTIFGATYLVLAPEHELVKKLSDNISNKKEVEDYIKQIKNKTDIERTREDKLKTGVELKGIKAINPANGEEIPIWIADYVLASYGTGAIMAVPQHDSRDKEFAEKYNLPIINRQLVDANEITKEVGGKIVTKYKLRDWVFSRQRYWGEPIPVLHDGDKIVPIKEKDLPVVLPRVKFYEPTGTGESPLANISNWVNVKVGKGKNAKMMKRETNTMPQWAGSSWYYLRYMDPKNNKALVDKKKEKYWNQVDFYVGGAEHATRHLIYARFWHKFLYDIGVVSTLEPFKKLQSVGLIIGEDGRKMSKRFGNIVNPDDIVKTYGADTLRLYEMFMGPFDQTVVWNTKSIIGSRRFLEKVWRIGERIHYNPSPTLPKGKGVEFKVLPSGEDLGGVASFQTLLHKTIKKVSEDIESMNFNTAVSSMMVLINEMESAFAKGYGVTKKDFKMFLQILSPFAPHITEELWYLLGEKKSINKSKWPKWDKKKIIEEEIKIAIQVNGKVRAEIMISKDITEEEIKNIALKNKSIIAWTENKEIKRVIYVTGKVINIVV